MKKAILFLFIGLSINVYSQNSFLKRANKWLTDNNFSIRKTFNGSSKDENKPASLLFRENYNSTNDFFNIDLAIKISEFEFFKNGKSSLIIYPKIEWHKSTDSTDLKNKLDGGFNFEYIPLKLKSPNIPAHLPNVGVKISPWFQGTSSFKENFIDNVFETSLSLQFSLVSNFNPLPGYSFRDNNSELVARYYPYLGIEYNKMPDLIVDGQTEEFSLYFIRFFGELWVLPRTVQITMDWTYKELLSDEPQINKVLSVFVGSIYLYPGKQDSLGIGFEYKHGYDSGSKFQLVQMSSLSLSWKI